MCTVSMVYQYGMERIPPQQWTPVTWPWFQQLVKQAEIFDEKTGQPDCVDPAKEEWARGIEERLRKLEEAASAGAEQPMWEAS